jgi:hypothetical protein
MPVIVVDPSSSNTPAMLGIASGIDYERSPATDLPREQRPLDFVAFIHGLIDPPSSRIQRQSLDDLIRESPLSNTWRFEYPLFLKLGGRPIIRQLRSPEALPGFSVVGTNASEMDFARVNEPNISFLQNARKTIDKLAVRYGQLFRSSLISKYLVIIAGIWISGIVGLLIPSISGVSIADSFLQICWFSPTPHSAPGIVGKNTALSRSGCGGCTSVTPSALMLVRQCNPASGGLGRGRTGICGA